MSCLAFFEVSTYKVRGTKVLSDDGVPDGLSGSSHSHGKGQEGEVGHALRVGGHEGLVGPHPGVVVDVSGLGETDDRVDEDIGAALSGGSDGQLSVGSVHRVSSLESNNLAPCDLVEVRSELGGGVWRQQRSYRSQACTHIGDRRSQSAWAPGWPGRIHRRRTP